MMQLDSPAIVAVAAAVASTVAALSGVANNWMTYRLQQRSAANGAKADNITEAVQHLHTCLEDKHAQLDAKIEYRADVSDALTVKTAVQHDRQ